MLITRYLDEPCPKCGVVGRYGNINVGQNVLNRGCTACGKFIRLPLPDLRKKIIYLDQFFLSHAFREEEAEFVEATRRIEDLAAKQLVVCPYSSVHTAETHLWRHTQKDELYGFIKRTARGYKFNQSHQIKQEQLYRAFSNFLAESSFIQAIDERNAFREDIHRWDDYFWIDMSPMLGDIDEMRRGKADAIAELVKLFPDWSKLTTSFEEDVAQEALGYGKSLLRQYVQMCNEIARGNHMALVYSPEDALFVQSLMHYDENNLDVDSRLDRIARFFGSEYFRNIPHVRISCGLFAVLRKLVKTGSYKNQEKAKKKLRGLFYDSECISVFGPYSDAIFIDRAMKHWCQDHDAKLLEPYNTAIFSAATWKDFHSYLDKIENNSPGEIKQALDLVYPETFS